MLNKIKEFFFGKPAVEAQPEAPYKVEAPVVQPAATPVKETPAKAAPKPRAKKAVSTVKVQAADGTKKPRKPRATKAK